MGDRPGPVGPVHHYRVIAKSPNVPTEVTGRLDAALLAAGVLALWSDDGEESHIVAAWADWSACYRDDPAGESPAG